VKTKGKTALAGLVATGLLAVFGTGVALAEEEQTHEGLAGPPAGEVPEVLAAPEAGAEGGGEFAPPGDADVLSKVAQFEAGIPTSIDLETVADVLGMTLGELHERAMKGESLAEIAGPSKTPELIDAIVAAQKERIEAERDAGLLSEEEAAGAVEGLREQVTALVEGEGPRAPETEGGDPANAQAKA
jgi:hypothetical protein